MRNKHKDRRVVTIQENSDRDEAPENYMFTSSPTSQRNLSDDGSRRSSAASRRKGTNSDLQHAISNPANERLAVQSHLSLHSANIERQ
jgi:hypothetical protein